MFDEHSFFNVLNTHERYSIKHVLNTRKKLYKYLQSTQVAAIFDDMDDDGSDVDKNRRKK